MIGVVVVTHGQLATELLNAAEMIVGDLPRFAAVSIGWHEDTQDAREEIAHACEFEYAIINKDFDVALQDLRAIIRAERLRNANCNL